MISNFENTALAKVIGSFTAKGGLLQTGANTPIGLLTALSIPNTAIEMKAAESVGAGIESASSHTNSEGYGSDHDEFSEQYTNQIVKAVDNSVTRLWHITKTVVPKMLSAINASVENAIPDGYSVQVVKGNALLNNADFLALLESNSAPSVEEVTSRDIAPAMNVAAVSNLIVTGVPSIDSDIVKLLAAHAPLWIEEVHNTWLTNSIHKVIPTTDLIAAQRLDEMVLLYLIARAYVDNPPANANITLEGWNSHMAKLRNQLARTIRLTVTNIIRRQQAGMLVLDFDAPNITLGGLPSEYHSIRVDGRVYASFLEAGGSPEILIGSAITDRASVVKSLLDNAQYYITAYNDFSQRTALAFSKNRATIMRGALTTALQQYAADESNGIEAAVSPADIKSYVERNTLNIESNPFDVTVRAIADLFHPNQLLDLVMKTLTLIKHTPDVPVSELIWTAVLNSVLDHLFSQVKIID